MRDIYLRPIGFAHVPNRERMDEVRGALPLAGSKHLDFLGLEVIERQGGATITRTVALSDLGERGWGRHAAAVSQIFDRLIWPRAAIAGLAMNTPRLMGIVNVTPDSFSDGGRFPTAQTAVDHALRLADEGAEILDIGGESTRPGSDPVSLQEELRRVMPVLEGLAGRTKARLSIDTRKAEVMRRAAAVGVDIINDISALTYDPEAAQTVAELGLPVVLMHVRGDPKTMQDAPHYDNVLLDVFDYLEARIEAAVAAGIARERIIVDPGIGFGKTLTHNLQILAGLSLFHGLGVPLLLGASRKRFIGGLLGIEQADERVSGSVGAAMAAAAQGVQIIRVHDVAATRQALTVWQAAMRGIA
ncbi:MAG TPA: dihydropteroate synthase [Hyphomicrobiaceae bacterium]|nr:dihydropteroate synthase [Hyphomicrobiaceae bacterium]